MSRIAVIILNYNGKDLTADCVSCFERFPHDYILIVVDNGSWNGDGQFIKSMFPHIHLIESKENLGFAGGNNLGIEYALDLGSEFVLLLNNDTLFDEDFIPPLIAELERDHTVGAVQPKIFFNHDRHLIWNGGGVFNPWLGLSYTIGEGTLDQGRFQSSKKVDWITGCCILVRSNVIREVGLMDHRFFMYQEDVDWSLRMRNQGYSLGYVPEAKIYHIAGASSKSTKKGKEGFQSPLVHFVNQRNRYWVIRKNLSWVYVPTATLYHIIRAVIFFGYFILRGRPTKFKAALMGFLAGFSSPCKEKIPSFNS